MKPFATRCLPIVAFSLLLAACQNAPKVAELPADESVSAFHQLDQSLSQGQLAEAETQLNALQQRAAGDTRLEQYQRQLAEAYLQQGQAALQKGDLDIATTALSRARSLLPQAPALTTGLDGAIAQARESELAQADHARAASEAAAAKETAARLEQSRQLRLAAERQAAAIQTTHLPGASREEAQPAVEPAQPTARLIDPNASTSAVPLPMLDKQDNEQLRRLLDTVAADVVSFRCAVRIEVRLAKDYPWVAALLTARVKKIDPSFVLQLSQALKPEQVPRLVLTPQAKG